MNLQKRSLLIPRGDNRHLVVFYQEENNTVKSFEEGGVLQDENLFSTASFKEYYL